jgi:hypothetical protein
VSQIAGFVSGRHRGGVHRSVHEVADSLWPAAPSLAGRLNSELTHYTFGRLRALTTTPPINAAAALLAKRLFVSGNLLLHDGRQQIQTGEIRYGNDEHESV